MARYWFGDAPADWVIASGDQHEFPGDAVGQVAVLMPGVTLWCWDYNMGDRVTDLLDAHGNPITEVTTDPHGRIPRFRGPDGVERLLIGQPPPQDPEAEVPPRHTILTTSYPDIVDGLRDRIAALEADSGGEYTSSAHPLIWTQAGDVETRVSPHVIANLDGRDQTVTHVRAAIGSLVGSAEVDVTVYTVDLDTLTHTEREVIRLDLSHLDVTVEPTWVVPDGQGVTVGVEVVTPGVLQDLTVQVMTK